MNQSRNKILNLHVSKCIYITYMCVRTWKVNGITRVQREIVEASPQGRAASESAWLNDSASFQR